jgi:hypothetical protein
VDVSQVGHSKAQQTNSGARCSKRCLVSRTQLVEVVRSKNTTTGPYPRTGSIFCFYICTCELAGCFSFNSRGEVCPISNLCEPAVTFEWPT